ncbi:hypothetical protein EKK58_06195 [Candidatus Dependentiae bacterium]|nr:MAG: hypothetical protein EKK58_06195 [Candidatus Dependentiae bacterium]
MTIKPLFTVTTGTSTSSIGNTIRIQNIFAVSAETNLTKDVASSSTSLTVANTGNFAVGQRVILGSAGQENAEFATLSGSLTATGMTISTGCSFTHNRGDSVQTVLYDRATIFYSATKNGTYSYLTTIDLDVTSNETVHFDVSTTAGLPTTWYKISFTNSGNSVTSGQSDAQVANGYDESTVEYLITESRRAIGNVSLDNDFFLGAINEARRTVNTEFGFGLANAWRAEFNYPVQLLAGTNYIDLPSNIDFTDTNRSVLAARFSRVSAMGTYPLRYIDKRRWNQLAYQNTFSYLASDTLGNGTATTLTLNSTGDFNTTGGVLIGTNKAAQSIISATYTANNLTTNTLSGLTGLTRSIGTFTVTIAAPGVFTCANHGLVEGDAICFSTTGALPTGINATSVFYVTATSLTSSTFTVASSKYGAVITTSGSQSGTHTLYNAIPAGTQIWAFQTNAVPSYYTVFKATVNGEAKNRLYFEAPIPAVMQGRMLYIDYYKKLNDVRTMSDTLDEPWKDAYLDYIKYAVKRRRDDSIGTDDEDFKRFMGAVGNIIGNVYTGQGVIAITG